MSSMSEGTTAEIEEASYAEQVSRSPDQAATLRSILKPRTLATLLLASFVGLLYLPVHSTAAVLIYLPLIGLLIPLTRNGTYIFVGRVLLPITIGFLVVWFWEYLHANASNAYLFRSALRHIGAIDDFTGILANLYAICIAFLLFKGLTDFDNLKNAFREEAGILQTISEFFLYVDREGHNGIVIDRIRAIFMEYIGNLKSAQTAERVSENDEIVGRVIVELTQLKEDDKNDEIAIGEIMKELSSLSRIRALRSSYVETKMSGYLLVMLTFLSAFLVMPFMLKAPDNDYVIHLIIFALSTAFTFLYIMLLDINDPYDGYWSIKHDAFADVSAHLQRDMQLYNRQNSA